LPRRVPPKDETMQFLASAFSNLGSGLFTAASFLFVLSIVVVIHELGHFQVARWCGVKVDEFAMGFGREIFGWYDSKGTRWRINWLPLGGYVKFMDDSNGASMPDAAAINSMTPEERATSFHTKPLWQRAAVIAAGPIANFILAIGILAAIFMTYGVPMTPAMVDEVVEGGAAARAGLKAGDKIIDIDGKAIESFSDLQRIVTSNPDVRLQLTYVRSGEKNTVVLTPERKEVPDGFGGTIRQGMLGIKRSNAATDWTYKRYGFLEALGLGVTESVYFIQRNLSYLRDIIVGREKADQLGGPIRIADAAGKVASAGMVPLLHLTAMISLSVGLFNLFPIPPLDGGHLLYYGAEAIRRRPLSETTQGVGFRLGLAFILMLAVFAFWNDLGILKRWVGG
jgi:regulator of sigma E protease